LPILADAEWWEGENLTLSYSSEINFAEGRRALKAVKG
jgi:hypothetical protein